jgi:radical SAM superfamily enzyme YgiQ (UPF0313 family)
MKVLLYKPGLRDGSENEIPNLGMAIIAHSVKDAGHEVRVVDGHFKPLSTGAPYEHDLICFSCVSQEWLTIDQILVKHHVPVWIGGPHAYGYADILEKDERLDKIIVGEGDGKFNTILESSSRVVNVGYADKLSSPDFSDFVGMKDAIGYPLYTSRGCTNRCNFCASGKAHGRFRVRPLDDEFWNEVDGIEQYPKVETVHVIDDAFTGNIGHAKQFLHTWLSRGYKWKLNIFNVRADQMDAEVLGMMKRCGIEELPIGVESADPVVFKEIGKGERLNEIREGIRMIQRAGIIPWLNMIVGLPKDNPLRHKASLEWVLSIPDPKIVHWFMYAPFRGTRAYDYFVNEGVIDDGFIPNPYGRRYSNLPWESDFETPEFSKEERRMAQLEAYLKCKSPILVNNLETVERLANENGLNTELLQWQESENLKTYRQKSLPYKKRKGQI